MPKKHKLSLSNVSKGFTLIEVLIVVAIIALLVVALTVGMKAQREKAEDARAKSDLERLKIAFEDYYSDNNCYPPAAWFDSADDCGGDMFQPYLNAISCDRRTGLPYVLEYPEYPESQCTSFRLYTTLTYPGDFPCSELGSPLGNYGVGSSGVIVTAYCGPSPSPTSTPTGPTPTPGQYGCQSTGSNGCNDYTTSAAASAACSTTFADEHCENSCTDPAYKCN